MKKTIFGVCHLCGTNGKLSFEHVPPDSAFNGQPILRTAFKKVLECEDLDNITGGQVMQRGAGGYTLCESCNSNTGSWYVPAFADWAHQAMRIVIGTRARPSLGYPFTLFPLRVLKQILCMFCSVNGPLFQAVNPDLVRFILNRESTELPDRVRVYAFYTFSDRARASGAVGLLRGLGSSASRSHVFSEITYPPFGFVMTLNSTPPLPDFCDISGFSNFAYRDWRCGITMRLPLMPVYTAFPGDYRTRNETLEQMRLSQIMVQEQAMRAARNI
jgi:hypothetical protein